MKNRIIGQAKLTAMMKKLRGGPQSLLPMSPLKGSGRPSLKGLTPKRTKGYVVPRQNPSLSPRTGGLVGLRRVK